MNRSNKKNLVSPIVGRCSVLCSEIIRCTAHTPNTVKHPFVDELKKDSAILFKYALRQKVKVSKTEVSTSTTTGGNQQQEDSNEVPL